MKMRWRHVLYPISGRRISSRRPGIMNRPVPFLGWLWYVPAAAFTGRFFAFSIFALLPSMWFLGVLGFSSPASQTGFAAVSLGLLSSAAGLLFKPKLRVRIVLPPNAACGAEFMIRYEVENTGRRAAYDVRLDTIPFPGAGRISIKPALVPFLPAGASCEVIGRGIANMRGKYELQQFRWDTSFPLGFWRWGKTDWSERKITVYPAYTAPGRFSMPLGPRDDSGNMRDRRITRSAAEFCGCREFRPGDSTRNLHPRSSARAGIPVVKEYQADGHGRTALVVDTWLRRQPAFSWKFSETPVEAAISAAAAVADCLSKEDRTIEFLAAGPEVCKFERSGKSGYLADVLDVLAAVEHSDSDNISLLRPVIADDIREIRSACVILCGWDKIRSEIIQDFLDRNIAIKVIMITHGGRTRKYAAPLPEGTVTVDFRSVLRGEAVKL